MINCGSAQTGRTRGQLEERETESHDHSHSVVVSTSENVKEWIMLT